jgi:paraquat-inducible protein B
MSEAKAKVTRQRRIAPIWIVPIVAVLLGVWMVIYTYRNQGPTITISFSTAEGIEAGKTKIKARSVDVGVVERVELAEDLERVIVTAKLDLSATPLLREDTQFWVVRPRVGVGGISGLGTIVSGGYVEMVPGTGSPGRRQFVGLDDVPVTPVGSPGLELTLVSSRAGSLKTGDPIVYRGFEVGRVERAEFDVESHEVRYGAFIDAPYDTLVTTATRFWNASGFSFSASAEGIELSTGSLQSLLFGGAAFDLPEGVAPGDPVEDGTSFDLFPDYESVNERPYRQGIEYVVEFARSVRGLYPGAPVEYRGLRAGTVERILIEELAAQRRTGRGNPIPVLLRLEPGRLKFGDSKKGAATLSGAIELGVRNGLRAKLATGNLLTGSLYVVLDFVPGAAPAKMGKFGDRPTIPTTPSGLEGIEQRITTLLDKLNALPLDQIARSADDTLRELNDTVAELRALVASEGVQSLPHSLEKSLAELDRTLQSVSGLATSLEDQPNALIFSREPEMDPEPKAGSP